MTEKTQSIVAGLFEHRTDVAKTITALLAANFRDDQIGFAARDDEAFTSKAHKTEQIQSHAQLQGESTETVETDTTATPPHTIARGIIGGIMGALDMLLVPITGPTDANTILESTLPVAEQALDRLPHRHTTVSEAQHEEATLPARPDAAMALPASSAITKEEPAAGTEIEPVAGKQVTREREGASIITGSVVGGVLGAAVALLIPGIGPVISGGILASVLGGAALGGVAGNFFGVFTEMGIPTEPAQQYEHAVRRGHTIVTVKTQDRQQEASNILREHGAYDIQVH